MEYVFLLTDRERGKWSWNATAKVLASLGAQA